MWIPRRLFLCVWLTVSAAYGQNDVRKPPTITRGPNKEGNFKDKSWIPLPCKAEGSPEVRYSWKKNGEDLTLTSHRITTGPDGDLMILEATDKDDGFYQCVAMNDYGTALATVAHIRKAYLDPEEPSSAALPKTVTEGHPYVISVHSVGCLPAPGFSWETAVGTDDKSPTTVSSPKMQVAWNGDLYVAYAEMSDALDKPVYKLVVYNSFMGFRWSLSYAHLTVLKGGSGPAPDFLPNITYFSQSQEVALIDKTLELKCFASGKPLPDIIWSGPGNKLPVQRLEIKNTQLTIFNVTEADEGQYACTARNAQGISQKKTLIVRVEAAPKFEKLSDGPHDVNVTEGEDVIFNCSAFAKPKATFVWFWNGQRIYVETAPIRFLFSRDRRSLTIRDVCRDCDNGERERKTDLMVIQCNASNVHGYAFAQGYLNVLNRTKVISLPRYTIESVNLTKESNLHFNCTATSDPSTPPTVLWYRVWPDERLEYVHDEPPYLSVTNGILSLHTYPNCSRLCHKYLAEYRCLAKTDYSQDHVTVMLNATEPLYEGLAQGTLNWIVIAVAILLLLLLQIVICCIFCYFLKGDEYDVDGKERRSGRNPEEEIKANDFQDYYPGSDSDKKKASTASIGSTDSFRYRQGPNEYYDDYAEHFKEDGSFVGGYSDKPLC